MKNSILGELYDAMLVPRNEILGVHPKGGNFDQSEVCPCGLPTGKLRKEIKLKVAWEDDMWDPEYENFHLLKVEIEEKVSKNESFQDLKCIFNFLTLK